MKSPPPSKPCRYQAQITPYAVGMAAKLADVFRHYLGAAQGDDEEAAMAAFNTMETLSTLLVSGPPPAHDTPQFRVKGR